MTEPEPPQRVELDEPIIVTQDKPWRIVGTVEQAKPWTVNVDGPVSVDGPVAIAGKVETTGVPLQSKLPHIVTSSASVSQTFCNYNPDRLTSVIYNDSTANLYLKFGQTASATDYSLLVYPGQGYELPSGYTDVVSGIWASANGQARVTDLICRPSIHP